jgi:hypothetical protein
MWENKSLTFGEIKEIIKNAGEGRLEKTTEKLDGMNLVFTWDVSSDELKVARTGSDIKKGGMDAATLAQKFFGRGNIELAFNSAFQVLNKALSAIPDMIKKAVFGKNGNRWYSMEIIYASEPNTINYDSNNVVFHGWPIFNVNDDGSVEQSNSDAGVDILTKNIERMQKAVGMKDWHVRGPSLLNMKKLSDGSIVSNAIQKVDAAMSAAGVSDSDTVYDYLRALTVEEVVDLDLPPNVAKATVERAIEAPGSMGVPEILKITPKEQQVKVRSFIKASEALMKKMIAPIESAIQEFAISVLKGIDSTLIAQSGQEVERLKAQVTKAIRAIESSGNIAAMDVLKREMTRLGSVENIGSAMEGIVFFYKGQAYKFTGSFAPAHQILSLFKYGRKGIPKMDLGESIHRLNEGGHAFSDVKPVTLEDFEEVWPQLRSDVEAMGATDVEHVGSTGKKPVMGDIDLAIKFDGNFDDLFHAAKTYFGDKNVMKVGGSVVSIRYGIDDEPFQVDLMMGNPTYLRWSRFGTSTTQGHPDYSPVKGVVRNVLLNAINRETASMTFPGKQSELERVRYSIDFDRGLFKVIQTKRGKDPDEKPLKNWKTVNRTFVSDDPDVIVGMMFGDNVVADDVRTFEGLVAALRGSRQLRQVAPMILNNFTQEIRDLVLKTPEMLGDDPKRVLSYINRVVKGR